MQVVAPVHLMSLVVAAVALVATCLILRFAAARRGRRRSRGVFVLGFACGLMAGSVLRGRRRGRRALIAVARHLGVEPRRTGLRARRVRSR